jgi:Kdo2-lipid IVA lauroyltransferase/acyltransferase
LSGGSIIRIALISNHFDANLFSTKNSQKQPQPWGRLAIAGKALFFQGIIYPPIGTAERICQTARHLICARSRRLNPPRRRFLGYNSTGTFMHRLRDTLAYTAVWLAIELSRLALRIFPRRFFLGLSIGFADLAFHLFSGFRRRSMANLTIALGDAFGATKIRTIARASIRNFFRSACEAAFAVGQTQQEIRSEIPVVGREHLASALAKGAGVIAVSGHLGNFFLVGTRIAYEGYPTRVLINQPKTGTLAEIFDRYRLKVGQKTIHARPRREAFRELTQVLRRNEIAVIIADEYRSGSGILAPFFGRTVLARRGPATLALRTGAALVPVCLVRRPAGELVLIIEPELPVERTGQTQADVSEVTRRLTQWLEKTVRSYPDQWNWMNIHWQQPASDASARQEHPRERVSEKKSFQQEETK